MEYNQINKGHLNGFITIQIDPIGLIIEGCCVFMKEGKRWFTLPTKKFTDKGTQEEKYRAYPCRFANKNILNAFLSAIGTAFDKYCQENAYKVDVLDKLPF